MKERARQLRRHATDAQRRLWRLLPDRQLDGEKFCRQHPLGPYVLDFYSEYRQLAIEVDGGHHFTAQEMARDEMRTRFLEAQGIRVVRFTNLDVLREPEAVVATIMRQLTGRDGTSLSPPPRERGPQQGARISVVGTRTGRR